MSPRARAVVFVSVALGVWLLQHLYVGWRLWATPLLAAPAARRALVALMATGFLAWPLGRLLWRAGWHRTAVLLEYPGAVWMGVLMLLFFALLAVDVLTLGGWLAGAWAPRLRAAAAVAALLAAAWAFAEGARCPRVVRYRVEMAGLPASLQGLRVVQLSDVHLGTLLGRRFLEHLVGRVEELRPDLLVITGDLFDAEIDAVEDLVPLLARLRAPLGVFAITGNHEHYAGVERCRDLMAAAGYTVLDNAHAEPAEGLFVAGVPDDRGARQTGGLRADLPAALEGIPADAALILLQHAPEEVEEAAAAGVDLMLTGHTHGGQIWPFHHLVRSTYRYLAGRYRVDGMTLVVSRGAGRWGPPMRFLAPSDIVEITLGGPGTGDGPPPARAAGG